MKYQDDSLKVRILNLEKTDNRWSWIIVSLWDDSTTFCHTNQSGEGIFTGDGYYNQMTGLCQFSLCGCSKSAAYKRIKRYFEG